MNSPSHVTLSQIPFLVPGNQVSCGLLWLGCLASRHGRAPFASPRFRSLGNGVSNVLSHRCVQSDSRSDIHGSS